MDKIDAAGTHHAQQAMLARMQQMQAQATGAAPDIAAANGRFSSPQALSFSQVFNRAINHVDALQHGAAARQKAVEMGQSDDLAGAMIESQKASVAFSAMMQVRNKLTSALDEVMNIPL